MTKSASSSKRTERSIRLDKFGFDPSEVDVGRCPGCDKVLIGRRGDDAPWHWAHHPDETLSCPYASELSFNDGLTASPSPRLSTNWHEAWKRWLAHWGADLEVVHQNGVYDAVAGRENFEFGWRPLPIDVIIRRERTDPEHTTWVYHMPPDLLADDSRRLWQAGGANEFRWHQNNLRFARHQSRVVWHVRDRLFFLEYCRVENRGDGNKTYVKFVRHDLPGHPPAASLPAPFWLDDAGRVRDLDASSEYRKVKALREREADEYRQAAASSPYMTDKHETPWVDPLEEIRTELLREEQPTGVVAPHRRKKFVQTGPGIFDETPEIPK